MYQVKTYQCGITFRAEAACGAIVALCGKTPVDAAKKIAFELSRTGRSCIVIAGDRPDRFRVEYTDFLHVNGEPVFIHNLCAR